ncbi:CYTH domain-containing protein [Steroidobacter agaridevorans]|uniref:CYTH domain-containing protein n=1 Tax=Steroidobacter agaridevorans TaxID=2695856 RepID=UPI0013213FE8|nr:CYTH domain-containing protein [Steroidobacter agaridevorans]GFE86448.1 hypothetical protein GCM10011488_14020 [Steroidobacter agaridevorans]
MSSVDDSIDVSFAQVAAPRQSLENKIRFRPTTQVKFLLLKALAGQGSGAPDQKVRQLLDIADFSIQSKQVQILSDEYFDDADFCLQMSGAGCRVRTLGSELELTVKALTATKVFGVFKRQETSATLTLQEYQDFKQSGALPVAFQEHGIPIKGPLQLKTTIINSRTTYTMVKAAEQYLLSVDHFIAYNSDRRNRSRDFVELEIEAVNEAALQAMSGVREKIGKILNSERNFRFSTGSKYDLAVQALHLKRNPLLQDLLSDGVKLAYIGMAVSLLGIILTLPLSAGTQFGLCIVVIAATLRLVFKPH